ncbi:MAG: UDP-N-acetylmuramoyl-tripeptide--D-alanyl-D-alanine ligase [Candidatus Neomarinimicrobiota bacterium]|nr:UDP-N-acetylmuramoyl-tripeptide--D-alanyl-D-alanine ligase [Candidatus Neomarinimicrobiota bacterium]MEC9026451.1 UDP-N-acetylmuramoyl-tripeptide--D-alanyl-D-alanine ligase [Candidatus Neomarinimicrobiota bacterium]|tara:strand:+ start:369 stop:1703 length:1335 start_codon:yes stop_codon:yes gene_type:complete
MRISLPDPTQFEVVFRTVTGHTIPIVGGISTDSRECRSGDLYIAICGEKVDGHDFIDNAVENGAKVVLAQEHIKTDAYTVLVNNTIEAISAVASFWRNQFDIPVIAITGSNGKTSTKELLRHVLNAQFAVHATEGNYNTSIGLPLTLFQMMQAHTISILEMGANQPGDIGALCSIANPTHGLITNIAPAHLEGFGSINEVAHTKAALFRAMSDKGIGFVNLTDPHISKMNLPKNSITFGITPDCDYPADIHTEDDGTLSLTISTEDIFTGSSNFSFAKNIIACAAIADTLNISWDLFRDRISTFQPPPGRCEIKKSKNMTFIDDTYNANVESTIAAIDYLTGFSGNGRRILIFGDMFELGDESKNQHIKVGQKCIESNLDYVFTVGTETLATHKSITNGPKNMHFETKEDLIKELKTEITDGDKILVKGSRGMAMETIIETLMK